MYSIYCQGKGESLFSYFSDLMESESGLHVMSTAPASICEMFSHMTIRLHPCIWESCKRQGSQMNMWSLSMEAACRIQIPLLSFIRNLKEIAACPNNSHPHFRKSVFSIRINSSDLCFSSLSKDTI